MSNPFALLDVDNEPQQKKVAAQKAAPKAAAAKAPAAKVQAAPKKDAKAAPKPAQKDATAPKGDRHTKFGRDAGEANTKRPHDRSLNRQQDKKVERKGEKSGVKGSWGNKDPQADQVAADVDQKKDDAEAKAEAAKVEEVKTEEKKPEEPAPFLLVDALKARKAVAGEKTKIRAADGSIAESTVLKAGSKPTSHVAFIHKSKSTVNANKKQLSLDEFVAVSGGQSKPVEQEQQRKQKKAAHFPAL